MINEGVECVHDDLYKYISSNIENKTKYQIKRKKHISKT